MTIFHKIAIDRSHPNYISGWCYHRFNKSKTVNLCLRSNGRVIARSAADRFREDLLELGLHPTGRCGFEIIIDAEDARRGNQIYSLTLADSTSPLAVFDSDLSVRLENISLWRSFVSLPPLFSRSRPRLLFMHIPKTAGTSFNTQVSKIFHPKKVASHLELENRARYPLLAGEKRYLSGHLRFGLFKDYFCSGDFRLYTIVREPYALLNSHLKWMIKTAQEESDNYFKYSNRVIYRLGKKLAVVDFEKTEQLEDFVENITDVEAKFFDNLQTRYFCEQDLVRVTEDDFRQAVNNMEEFSLIGITERYDQFLQQFIVQNKLAEIKQSGRLNRSESAALFDGNDPEVRTVLLPLVQYDLRLYDIAEERA